jgi:hypothetical protein
MTSVTGIELNYQQAQGQHTVEDRAGHRDGDGAHSSKLCIAKSKV